MDSEIVKLNAEIAALKMAFLCLFQALPGWQRASVCTTIIGAAEAADEAYIALGGQGALGEERAHQTQLFLNQPLAMARNVAAVHG
jgi:hypothetical protein